MNVYKLAYSSRSALDSALKSRQILKDVTEEGDTVTVYGDGTHAVVYLGHIVLEAGEYDSEGSEVKAPVLSKKYHADIMVEGAFDFGSNDEGDPSNPVHKFETE